MDIFYYSNVSENTHRFVQKLARDAHRLPLRATEDAPEATAPYVLITPTYGTGRGTEFVPRPVIKFLNSESNRGLLKAVVGSGNTNFGGDYTKAVDTIAAKCEVPVLHRFELLGLDSDVEIVNQIIDWMDEQ